MKTEKTDPVTVRQESSTFVTDQQEETKIIVFQQERIQMYQSKELHIPEEDSAAK